jgi:hypothetical protein
VTNLALDHESCRHPAARRGWFAQPQEDEMLKRRFLSGFSALSLAVFGFASLGYAREAQPNDDRGRQEIQVHDDRGADRQIEAQRGDDRGADPASHS